MGFWNKVVGIKVNWIHSCYKTMSWAEKEDEVDLVSKMNEFQEKKIKNCVQSFNITHLVLSLCPISLSVRLPLKVFELLFCQGPNKPS